MTVSPARITPPTVCTLSWWITPAVGVTHFDAVELVARGDALFDEFAFLGLRLTEILDHLGAEILVELDDLQLRFADLGFRLGDAGDQLSALALDACRLALQGRQPGERHQPLVVEVLDAGQFAVDQLDLLCLRDGLRFQAGDFVVQLRHAGPAEGPSGSAGRAAGLEERESRTSPGCARWPRSSAWSARRKVRLVQSVALGGQTRNLCARHSSSCLLTVCRLAWAWVGSSRSNKSPTATCLPLSALISATTPPVGC